jgi:prepilin-type N-terminal cleavage/methylation domain-containing protein
MSTEGFTLVELLVAVTLSALLIAAALGAFAAASRNYREAEQLARLQERASYALSVLEPDIQLAGFGGLRALSGLPISPALPPSAETCGIVGTAPLTSLRISAARYALACPAHGGGAVDGADVLSVIRASGRLAEPWDTGPRVLTSRAVLGPSLIIGEGALPANTALAPGRSELRNLLASSFYLARHSDGAAPAENTPALRVKELITIAGAPAIRDTEVLPGVEDLRFEEGWRARDASAEPLEFTRPGIRPANRPLDVVRVFLLLRSDTEVLAPRAQQFTYAGRSFTARDGRLRLLAERSIALRNPLSAAVLP